MTQEVEEVSFSEAELREVVAYLRYVNRLPDGEARMPPAGASPVISPQVARKLLLVVDPLLECQP